MNQFEKDLHSPYWWLSVILVGFVINLLSGWLKDAIDAAVSRIVKKWAERTPAKHAQREARIERLRRDRTYLLLGAKIEMSQRIEAIISLLVAILNFFFALTFSDASSVLVMLSFLMAAIMVGFAGIELTRARTFRAELDEATRRELVPEVAASPAKLPSADATKRRRK